VRAVSLKLQILPYQPRDQHALLVSALAAVAVKSLPAHRAHRPAAHPGPADWSRNDQDSTTAAVYSLRARQRPTVSTPVSWKELESAVSRKKESALSFETDDVLRRVSSKGDLFEPVLKLRQKLPHTI